MSPLGQIFFTVGRADGCSRVGPALIYFRGGRACDVKAGTCAADARGCKALCIRTVLSMVVPRTEVGKYGVTDPRVSPHGQTPDLSILRTVVLAFVHGSNLYCLDVDSKRKILLQTSPVNIDLIRRSEMLL